MKIFDIDSPLMRVLGKVTDLVVLNLLTVLMCIPIVTAGASFTAMHYCCLKIVRGHENKISKQFFHSFKDNMRQSTVIWLVFLLLLAFFGGDLYLMYLNPSEVSTFILGGIIAALALLFFAGTMVFPLQAKFYNPIPKTIKTAFLFSFRHFPQTLLVMLATLFPFSLFLIGNLGILLFPLILCFCFSAPGYLSAKFYDKDFAAAEEAILAKNPQSTDSQESESGE
ncbi:MAG: DUF624 domain-containing protein [Lachnospiraceae bacterium]|nr:DUF624 domain-containing protein [Lachnospiraceae bacterium]